MQCTFWGNSAESGAALYDIGSSDTPSLENTVIAFSESGEAIACPLGRAPALSCCDLYGNAGGDWTDCVGDQYGTNGNISEDPLLCDPENQDYSLQRASPCAPENNPECGLIGAWPVGCGSTPVEESTWGAIKGMFR